MKQVAVKCGANINFKTQQLTTSDFIEDDIVEKTTKYKNIIHEIPLVLELPWLVRILKNNNHDTST